MATTTKFHVSLRYYSDTTETGCYKWLKIYFQNLRSYFDFHWMWIFTWIKFSWHSCSRCDKIRWRNWFWQFLGERLSSFHPKRFWYSYVMPCSLCEGRISFCTRFISKKLCRFLLALLPLALYSFFLYRSHSSCTVFDAILSNMNQLLLINLSANVFVFEDYNVPNTGWLTYAGGTDRPGELYYNFSISNELTHMANFATWIPDFDSHSPALLDLFISHDASIWSTMAFPPLENSDHAAATVSIDFLSNSKGNAPFHCIVNDYSHLIGMVFAIIWEMFHGRIFSNLVLLLLLVNSVIRFKLELIYMSLIINTRSNLLILMVFSCLCCFHSS